MPLWAPQYGFRRTGKAPRRQAALAPTPTEGASSARTRRAMRRTGVAVSASLRATNQIVTASRHGRARRLLHLTGSRRGSTV